MVEEILPNLYRIQVPLPRNPLKSINSFVIKTSGRNLMIDTGMNREECIEVMNSALSELDVDLSETDFFITHLHADHLGLVSYLGTDSSKIYFNEPDANAMSRLGPWERMAEFGPLVGFPRDELVLALQRHPGNIYGPRGALNFSIVRENDVLEYGDYRFKCVETPGHTSGNMCLYEEDKKILVSGDHVLIDITPNISLWSDRENPLEDYLNSLDKVAKLEVNMVLPGHRSLFTDCNKRIDELKQHHRERNNEIIEILRKGGQDAYRIASQMTWDIVADSWEDFPPNQKFFATGEAIAHLKYLTERGEIQREEIDGKYIYSVV